MNIFNVFEINSCIIITLFIYLGFYVFLTLYSHIAMANFVGRGNQYIQLVKVLYCKLPTTGNEPSFPHKVRGLNRQPQGW